MSDPGIYSGELEILYMIGDWLYYRNYSDLRRTKTDGSLDEITPDDVWTDLPIVIGYSDEWLYCLKTGENDKYNFVKMNLNNNQEIIIINDDFDDRYDMDYPGIYHDGYIYCKGRDYYIYRFDVNDAIWERVDKLDKIYNNLWQSFNISDGYIYYSSGSDSGKLYKAKIDGTGKEKLADISVRSINILGDWIYFIDGYSPFVNTYRVKKDGTKLKYVDSIGLLDKIKGVNSFAVEDDWIYYSNALDENKLYKAKLNGTQKTKLCDKEPFGIVAYEKNIGFSVSNGDEYLINRDGTELKLIWSVELEREIGDGRVE